MSPADPMERAIHLAQQALGTTSPNPAVGAVVVKDGVTLGSGHTQPPGGPHAEIMALGEAGPSAKGAALYTTLEPCCTYGRTPPCTDAIINAGIKEVHIGAIDPNPRVSGDGAAQLETAGIEVHFVTTEQWPLGTDHWHRPLTELYEAFAKHITTGLPFVTSKFAMSLDGKIATRTGDSKWVTGPEARARVQHLRREADAVMVGVNTVLADNPQLTARDADGAPLSRQPLRVILDSRCRTPPDARLLREPGATLILTTGEAPEDRISALGRAGAEVLTVANAQSPVPDHRPLTTGHWPPSGVDLHAALKELGRRGVVTLLVEAGGTLQGGLFDAGLVDKVFAFVAPLIIGGAQAASPVEGAGPGLMAETHRLYRTRLEQYGPDWLITGYPRIHEGRPKEDS